VTATDWALVVAAGFWAVLVIALVVALFRVLGLLDRATRLVDEATDQTVDLLSGANETVAGVNVELARVDTIIAGVQSITHTTDQLVGVVHATVSNPLVKAAAYVVGASRTVSQLRGGE
jgi:hypothetical protein